LKNSRHLASPDSKPHPALRATFSLTRRRDNQCNVDCAASRANIARLIIESEMVLATLQEARE